MKGWGNKSIRVEIDNALKKSDREIMVGDAKCKHVVIKANEDNRFEGKHSIRERRIKFPQQLGKNRI